MSIPSSLSSFVIYFLSRPDLTDLNKIVLPTCLTWSDFWSEISFWQSICSFNLVLCNIYDVNKTPISPWPIRVSKQIRESTQRQVMRPSRQLQFKWYGEWCFHICLIEFWGSILMKLNFSRDCELLTHVMTLLNVVHVMNIVMPVPVV